MRKATLLYNARSGGRRERRENHLRDAVKILADAGVEVSLNRTQSSLDATEQGRRAILDGCDTVFACGGDGTVHDVLQALAGTRVALGVIPMGTANALAHDLGIPMDACKAVRAALEGEPRRIPVGQVTVRGADGKPFTRFFTVAVGVGVDAHLFYKLNAGTKQRLGMAAYYAKAWHLWFTHRMERFRVDWEGTQAGSHGAVTELLAVRIANFGGVLQKLAPGASLEHDHLRLVVCRTSSRIAYLNYVTRSFLRGRWSVPGVDVTDGKTVRCDYSRGAAAYGEIRRVYVEADGELIGTLPAEITVVPDALTILAPKKLRV